MRTVFFGTPELAVPSLAALAQRHTVCAVVCQPDKPRGRGKKLEAPPVKRWALEHGVPVMQPRKFNDGVFEDWLRAQAPDICTIAAFGRLLRQPILDVPPRGFINMHPSLLPRWRGPSPIQSAVIHGDRETGVSIMKLTLQMDSGPLVLQERKPIGPEESAAALSDRLATLGGALLARALDEIAAGTAVFTPQDDGAATYCRLLRKEDGYIDWSQPARAIHDLVRGCQPWPAAQTRLHGRVCKLHETRVEDTPAGAAPGTVVHVDKRSLHVAAGEGRIAVCIIQAPNKRALPVDAFLRGHPVTPGERFEPME